MSAETPEQVQGTAGTASPGLSGLEAENFELEPIVHIGTRRSALALAQTDIVKAALTAAWPGQRCEIHAMATMGDKNQTTALHAMGAKNLWTHELEALLATGELDMIVHSLKDMPTTLPPDLSIGAIFPREDPRDAFVLKASLHDPTSNTPRFPTLASLPPDSIIGTSSVRRAAQLKRRYPHLRFADVRGNLGTRLAKLDGTWTPEDPATVVPEYSALILAAAGLKRLDLGHRITALLSAADGGMLHAVGQGALGIEVRAGDERVKGLLARVGCERSARACLAERALMRTLEGGCSVPIGVESAWVDGATGAAIPPSGENNGSVPAAGEELVVRAMVVSLDGSKAAEVETRQKVASRDEAEALGREVARQLVERGAGDILNEINKTR